MIKETNSGGHQILDRPLVSVAGTDVIDRIRCRQNLCHSFALISSSRASYHYGLFLLFFLIPALNVVQLSFTRFLTDP